MHDFLTVGAPAPLQTAAAVGFAFDARVLQPLHVRVQGAARVPDERAAREVGFEFAVPEGAYYIFADFSKLSDLDDVTFAKWMTQEIGVATVPGSSFYSNKEDGRSVHALRVLQEAGDARPCRGAAVDVARQVVVKPGYHGLARTLTD